MDEKHTASAGSEERPPLGSDEAIDKVAEAMLAFKRDDPDGLSNSDMDKLSSRLHFRDYLRFKPHPLEVIEAIRDLGLVWVYGPNRTGTSDDLDDPDVEKRRAEDFFQEYMAGVRKREMEQRRNLAARRRRDAELLGLSAEESDRAQERRESLMEEMEKLDERYLGPVPYFPPADWQPDEATLAEGKRMYLRYLDRRTRWHHQRPDVHPPIESHDGNQIIRDFAWDAEWERRAAKIREELRALGDENP